MTCVTITSGLYIIHTVKMSMVDIYVHCYASSYSDWCVERIHKLIRDEILVISIAVSLYIEFDITVRARLNVRYKQYNTRGTQ
jgi:hypothetical protein